MMGYYLKVFSLMYPFCTLRKKTFFVLTSFSEFFSFNSYVLFLYTATKNLFLSTAFSEFLSFYLCNFFVCNEGNSILCKHKMFRKRSREILFAKVLYSAKESGLHISVFLV